MKVFNRGLTVIMLAVVLVFVGCNKIPNKSICEELSTEELATAV